MRKYEQDQRMVDAILERLLILLKRNPKPLLKQLVSIKAKEYPEVNPKEGITILEDKVLQDLINLYDDQELEDLWQHYNYNYFEEDTYEDSHNSYYVTKPKRSRAG